VCALASDHEFEALPEPEEEFEYEGEWEAELDGELESEEFFRRLVSWARTQWGTRGSPLRRVALGAAQGTLRAGLPAAGGLIGTAVAPGVGTAIGSALGGAAGYGLGGLVPEPEFEGDFEGELNPIQRVNPDALMEHLGHAAMEAETDAEAEAFIGALIPLAARILPQAAPAILRAAPSLIRGLVGATQALRRSPAFRPLMRTIPTIVRRTAANVAQRVAQGQPVTPHTAVRALAGQTARVLSSPHRCVRAYQQSRALDRQYHRAASAGMRKQA